MNTYYIFFQFTYFLKVKVIYAVKFEDCYYTWGEAGGCNGKLEWFHEY